MLTDPEGEVATETSTKKEGGTKSTSTTTSTTTTSTTTTKRVNTTMASWRRHRRRRFGGGGGEKGKAELPVIVPIDRHRDELASVLNSDDDDDDDDKDRLIINEKVYRKGKVIGQGGSSKVIEAISKEGGACVAVKCVDLSNIEDSEIEMGYLQEVKMLKMFNETNCPRIIKLIDWEYQERKGLLFIVMEKAERDLGSMMRIEKLKKLTIQMFWVDMLRAVQAVHKEGVVHGDLKPANFVVKDDHLYLIDFGIADQIDDGSTSVNRFMHKGTANYMAPEAINYGGRMKVGPYSDVWSLGCILYSMVGGRPPFADKSAYKEKLVAIIDSSYEIPFPKHWDFQVVDVIRMCLKRDPKKRATIHQLLSHSFLNEYCDSLHPPSSSAAETNKENWM